MTVIKILYGFSVACEGEDKFAVAREGKIKNNLPSHATEKPSNKQFFYTSFRKHPIWFRRCLRELRQICLLLRNFSTLRFEKLIFDSGNASTKNVKLSNILPFIKYLKPFAFAGYGEDKFAVSCEGKVEKI